MNWWGISYLQKFKNLPEISKKSLQYLKKGKNLLAFSGGVDSSSLFFILLAHKIDFDIAIVDYNTREESKKEVAYAKELSKKYDKTIYLKNIKIKDKNFEHNARKVRYSFFEEIIYTNNYNNLITAHQLDDKLEWFLMQFAKGAGLIELIGFDEIRIREKYTLIRPLIEHSKDELKNFLQANSIKYFIDKSNKDKSYKRNYFRETYSAKFLKEYKSGIVNSFKYLQNDKKRVFKLENIKNFKKLYIFENFPDDLKNIRTIDIILKKLDYVLSKSQRDEILKVKNVVISNKYVVAFAKDKIYISPFCNAKMDKKFKEACRIRKIPQKIRPYLFTEKISPDLMHYNEQSSL